MTEFRTYPECAAELRVPLRTFRALIQRHQPPVIVAGRRKLLDDVAFRSLIESMRRCPSASANAKAVNSGGSPGLSPAAAFAKALELSTVGLPRNTAPRAKAKLRRA